MFNWLKDNKEWVFSGIGVFVITLIVNVYSGGQTSESPKNNDNDKLTQNQTGNGIQIVNARDININPAPQNNAASMPSNFPVLSDFSASMPSNFPVLSDFSQSDLKTDNQDWEFRRDPGKGGKNYGIDLNVPEGNVIVAWDTSERSCISCRSGRDVKLTFNNEGALRYPNGVHAGVRIDTGSNPFGAGGSYKGTARYVYVPYDVWKRVYVEKYL